MRGTLPPLELLPKGNAWQERNRILSGYLREKFKRHSGRVKVLEAGCGRAWPLDLGELRLEITGVDADRDALDARVREVKDLDRPIVGDLRAVEFDREEFDIVYSCEVLEHIKGAEQVLKRLLKWLKPDGVVVLIFPDRDTVFGRATRYSPHWLHVAYHRYILGMKHAGTPGFGPYPTYYDDVISRRGMHSFCAKHGCRIALEYGRPPGEADWPGWFLHPYQILAPALSMLSGGTIAASHIGLIYGIEKTVRK